MAKVKDNTTTKVPDFSVLTGWLQFSKDASRKRYWDFFVIDQFLKGNHNIKASADNTITVGSKVDAINFPINKMYSTFRAVRAFVTRHKPVVTVDPELSTPEAIAYARRANALLARDNQLNNFRRINKEWVYYGIKYGIGWRQVGYDKNRKCCIRWSIDPWDFLLGDVTREIYEQPYVIKVVKRSLGYWKFKFPKYKDQFVPDNEVAEDEYKKLSMQIQYEQEGISPANSMDEQTAIGYECWYRTMEPNALGGHINKVIFMKNFVVEDSFEETPYDSYPFIPYNADVVPNETFSEGHMKHIIAPQRMLNLLNTQMLEYNHLVNRGRFIKDKNAGFKVINTREGQIIEKNPGRSVQVLNPPGINPLLENQLNLAIQFIEDLGGQHQASMGATPSRVSSGDAIEALQMGDSNNISDLRDNFEDALAMEAAWILKMYSLHEKDGIVMTDKLPGNEMDAFAVVGAEAYQRTDTTLPEKYFAEEMGDYCSVCAILPDNKVKVSVTSQLGETREARLNLLFRLVELGLPLQFVLNHLEFPNTQDILQRIAEEQVADLEIERMKAMMAPQPGQAVPGQGIPGARGGMAPPPVDGGEQPVPTPPQVEAEEPGDLIAILNELSARSGRVANA